MKKIILFIFILTNLITFLNATTIKYTGEETIKEIYGKDIKFVKSDQINIRMPKVKKSGIHIHLEIKTKIKAKNIAIFRDTDSKNHIAHLVSIFHMNTNSIANYSLLIDLSRQPKPIIIVIIEGEDGKFYINKKTIQISNTSDFSDKFNLLNLEKRKNKNSYEVKIRNRLRDGVCTGKFMISRFFMLTVDAAKRSGYKANFIAHIVAKVKNKKVFELYPTPYLSSRPQFTFEYKGATKGDKLELIITDNHGNHTMAIDTIK